MWNENSMPNIIQYEINKSLKQIDVCNKILNGICIFSCFVPVLIFIIILFNK